MTRLLAVAFLLLASDAASAEQQKQFYGADGRNAGRALTDSQGHTTYYGADGKVQARSTTSGNTTTVYGSDGRKTGTVQWQK
jgi:hypothetical protein